MDSLRFRHITVRSGQVQPFHRVVLVHDGGNQDVYQTKGDNNRDSIKNLQLDETNITQNRVIGKAVLRIPFLGYIKIGFVELLSLAGLL